MRFQTRICVINLALKYPPFTLLEFKNLKVYSPATYCKLNIL